MAFNFVQELPEADEVLALYPQVAEHKIEERRNEMRAILSGEDHRLLVVEGPCSFYPIEAGLEHADAMEKVYEEVKDVLRIAGRVYIQKPRTRGGWAGIKFQANPNGPVDAKKGIMESRRAMSEAARRLPIADEVLFPEAGEYFENLLSYGAIGARNIESMYHRWAASGFDFPMGMKNARSGGLHSVIDGIVVAQQSNPIVMNRKQFITTGNPYAHLILRGAHNRPNYDCVSVEEASNLLDEAGVKNPAIMIDASHDNAIDPLTKKRTPERQIAVLQQVIRNRYQSPGIFGKVKGVMFESFMKSGNQKIGPNMDMSGLSITDPCVGLEDSKKIIYEMAEEVRKHHRIHV